MQDSGVSLADAIQQLRQELQKAMEAGADESLRFEVLDVELELQVLVSEESSGKIGAEGGIKFWLVDAKTQGELSDQYGTSQVQKVKLKLRPKPCGDDGDGENGSSYVTLAG
jgi:hypothetical protein